MKNTRFAIATALTGALTLAGCTAAAASGTAGAGHAAPLSGLTHVVAYSINTDSPVLTSVVSGAIGDYGPAEEVSPGSTGVSAHGGELELKLTHGTFRLNIAAKD